MQIKQMVGKMKQDLSDQEVSASRLIDMKSELEMREIQYNDLEVF